MDNLEFNELAVRDVGPGLSTAKGGLGFLVTDSLGNRLAITMGVMDARNLIMALLQTLDQANAVKPEERLFGLVSADFQTVRELSTGVLTVNLPGPIPLRLIAKHQDAENLARAILAQTAPKHGLQ